MTKTSITNNERLMNADIELRHLLKVRKTAQARDEDVSDVNEEIRNLRMMIRAELVPAQS